MSYQDDSAYQVLQQLRSEDAGAIIADAWQRWAGLRPEKVYTKSMWTTYRPHRKARVVLNVVITAVGGQQFEMDMLFCAFSDDASFKAQLLDCAVQTPADVFPPMQISEWRTLGWVLPYVPKPKDLPQLMDSHFIASLVPESSCNQVESLELVRYVPMRRGLVRFKINDKEYYAKTFARHQHYLNSSRALGVVAGIQIRVPQLVALAPEKNTLVMNSLSGVVLSQYLVKGPLEPLIEAGRALASIHHLDLGSAKTRLPEVELADIEQLLVDELAPAKPDLAQRCTGLVNKLHQELKDIDEIHPVLIHGKLFGDQILYDSTAICPIAIVDWDDLTKGDPHFDLGRLIAHLLFDAALRPDSDPGIRIKALLDGYQYGGGVLSFMRLKWYVAASLLLRGKISLLRCLAPDWEARLERIIVQAENVLEDGIAIPETPLAKVVAS